MDSKNLNLNKVNLLKFIYTEKTKKIWRNISLRYDIYLLIYVEDFVNFCDLLRKPEL